MRCKWASTSTPAMDSHLCPVEIRNASATARISWRDLVNYAMRPACWGSEGIIIIPKCAAGARWALRVHKFLREIAHFHLIEQYFVGIRGCQNSGTYRVPEWPCPGHGTGALIPGLSRPFRDGWQPYLKWRRKILGFDIFAIKGVIGQGCLAAVSRKRLLLTYSSWGWENYPGS